MFHRPNYIGGSPRVGTVIHESPDQLIQGGIPGEHYHISGPLYQFLIDQTINRYIDEVVMTVTDELVTLGNGELVFVRVLLPNISVPDMVSPANPTSFPPSDSNLDPYWDNVISSCPLDLATGTTGSYSDTSQYGNAVFFAGSNSPGSALKQLFLKNTVQAFNDSTFLGLTGYASIPNSAYFTGNFTVEAHLLTTTKFPRFSVGNSVLAVVAEIDDVAGAGRLAVYSNSYITAISAPFTYPYSVDSYRHWVIERKGSDVQLKINGVIIAAISHLANLNGVSIYSNYFANFRVTKNIARYNMLAITPPVAPYPIG